LTTTTGGVPMSRLIGFARELRRKPAGKKGEQQEKAFHVRFPERSLAGQQQLQIGSNVVGCFTVADEKPQPTLGSKT
jgi:hypothetical protein